MNLMPKDGWSLVSGTCGGLFYSKLMRFIDGYLLGMTRTILPDSVVFDAGAGNGNFGIEAAKAGAKLVCTIENNPKMIEKINSTRLLLPNPDRVRVIERNFYDGVISELAKENRPRIIHFRRCLYREDDAIINVLKESYDALLPGGYIFVIQAERDNRLFDDDGFGRVALDHVLKRATFSFNSWFKDHHHRRFSREELEHLCLSACPFSEIEHLPKSRPAYHFIAMKKTSIQL